MVKLVPSERIGKYCCRDIYVVEFLLVKCWNPMVEGIFKEESSWVGSVRINKVDTFGSECA